MTEIPAELGGIVAVGRVHFFACQMFLRVQPERPQAERAQAGTLQSVGVVYAPLAVEQDGERRADFLHPLLDAWKGSKRNDEDAGVQVGKFLLARAQLCGMFAAGYSAKVTKKNQQDVIAVFQNFAKRNLLAFGGGQSEVGGGGM